eukprot:scaffold22447_cov29-Tisochrysis_lutea.AAC.2
MRDGAGLTFLLMLVVPLMSWGTISRIFSSSMRAAWDFGEMERFWSSARALSACAAGRSGCRIIAIATAVEPLGRIDHDRRCRSLDLLIVMIEQLDLRVAVGEGGIRSRIMR